MDVFSHGLWAGALFKALNLKKKSKPLNVWWAAFWGVFPDAFAFAIPFIFIIYSLITGAISLNDFPPHGDMETHEREELKDGFFLGIADSLYNLTHSLLVFFIVFLAIFLVMKRPIWVLGGWLLHIIMDIPTHSYQFYPTPFLWPLSDWKFNGFSWGQPWFIITNYTLIIIAYIVLWRLKKK